jgi:F0F1-type ATP synthase epsilon subunit
MDREVERTSKAFLAAIIAPQIETFEESITSIHVRSRTGKIGTSDHGETIIASIRSEMDKKVEKISKAVQAAIAPVRLEAS